MTDRGQVYTINKKTLEAHLSKVDGHLESIDRGSPLERDNLFKLVQGIGSTNKNLMADEVNKTVEALRESFALYYEMQAILEDQAGKVNSGVAEPEKRAFRNSYSTFAASSFMLNRLNLLIGDKELMQFDTTGVTFNFDATKDDALNIICARYYGLINAGKRNSLFETGLDVPKGSVEFFKYLREQALKNKSTFNPKLVDLVKDANFKIADEFTITGFETGFEEKIAATAKTEFVPLEPYEVAGNVLAKQEMLRDMDRIVLFDLMNKKNPILDVGGLSWSVLYDGLPGTGKDTLFKMGLTRLHRRSEQVSAFWKSKNFPNMNYTKIDIDQGVKDEYYGKTGKNLLEKLSVTRRADGIYIVLLNDLDLLVSGDRNSSSGGGDKDIMNILMQYADSVNTVIRGNVQLWAATNDATAMDPALRQRFIARYSVDGPQTWYDFSDILYNKLRKWVDTGIVAVSLGSTYKPFEMRKGENIKSNGKNKVNTSLTMREIGDLFANEKTKNPRFTGRAVHAVSEAIKKRINDYNIPEEWYTDPKSFLEKPYEDRVSMLRDLCIKVDGETIASEISRYAESEGRYAADKFESDVERVVHNAEVQGAASTRIKQKYGVKDE